MSNPRAKLFETINEIIISQKNNPLLFNEVSLIVLDISNFSMLNLHLGEIASNDILQAVEKRLKAQPWVKFATRLSSDEYAILAENGALTHSVISKPMLSQYDSNVAFMRIAEIFDDPFEGMRLCFSGGLAPFSNQESPHQWISQAFVALREAKRLKLINRGAMYQIIHLDLVDSVISDSNEFHAVNDGLKERSFILYFQPQWRMIGVNQFKLVGAEALVRAQREGKIIGPDKFISIAEESGSIVMLGQQVVEMSCRARAALDFSDEHVLSWNVSPIQIEMDYNLLALIDFTVQNSGLKPHQVKIEITESEMLNKTSIVFLENLMKLGYKVAIDDFGTEHAALAVLTRFRADTIKIDKSFLVDVPENKRKAMMLGDLITMIHHQELDIVIEGVETQEQVDFLYEQQKLTRPLIIQGYFLGRPMNALAMQELLKKESLTA